MMSIRRLVAAGVLLTSLASTQALAFNLEWRNVRAVGGGDGTRCYYSESDPGRSNVQFLAFGGDASFVFDSFGINLKRRFGGGPLKQDSSCNIEADVIIPQGFYVRTLTQNIIVGIKKDKLAAGGLSTNGFLFQRQVPVNQLNWPFPPDSVVDDALASRSNTQVFDQGTISFQCARTAAGPWATQFKFQLLAAAVRPVPLVEFRLNVDAADLNYELRPTLERCQ
jgi:hypothetical protein